MMRNIIYLFIAFAFVFYCSGGSTALKPENEYKYKGIENANAFASTTNEAILKAQMKAIDIAVRKMLGNDLYKAHRDEIQFIFWSTNAVSMFVKETKPIDISIEGNKYVVLVKVFIRVDKLEELLVKMKWGVYYKDIKEARKLNYKPPQIFYKDGITYAISSDEDLKRAKSKAIRFALKKVLKAILSEAVFDKYVVLLNNRFFKRDPDNKHQYLANKYLESYEVLSSKKLNNNLWKVALLCEFDLDDIIDTLQELRIVEEEKKPY